MIFNKIDSFVNDELIPRINKNDYWRITLRDIINNDKFNGIHLAILNEPYLQYILDGKKTIESRFSINKIAPYRRVKEGDIILLKKTSGPIIGLCEVDSVWYYQLDISKLNEIKNVFGKLICAQGKTFWSERKKKSFASLMRIKNVIKISPLSFKKKDRRGWVVLKSALFEWSLENE